MHPPSSEPARWEKLGSTTLASTRVFEVQSTRFRHPGRKVERDFAVLRPPDWVNILALTPDHQLVLVKQFRFGIDGFSVEIPGGMIEAGEDPVVAAQRELREETGFAGTSARLLGSVFPNPAFQSNRCHFVLVEQAVSAGPQEWDTDEEIAVTTLPVDDVLALARAGRIMHGLVLDALFYFEPLWGQMKSKAKSGTPQSS